jgi:hypothetical protein
VEGRISALKKKSPLPLYLPSINRKILATLKFDSTFHQKKKKKPSIT